VSVEAPPRYRHRNGDTDEGCVACQDELPLMGWPREMACRRAEPNDAGGCWTCGHAVERTPGDAMSRSPRVATPAPGTTTEVPIGRG